MNRFRAFFFFVLLASCSHSSLESKKIAIKKRLEIVQMCLKNIQSKEDLKLREKKIKKQIDALALLIVSMKKESFSQEIINLIILNAQKESGFEKEFLRVMDIEGCREVYQNLSLDALYLLDAFERKMQIPYEKNAKLKKIEEY